MASDFDDEYLSEMIHNPSEDDVRRALAKELLAHRKAEPAAPDGWIKCKDRLPAGEEFVLACWSHTGHVEDVFFAFDEDEPEQRYHVLYDGERMLQGPTHWKPLELPQDN
ncbi:DUF551 domain-containing protein [Pantoea septica]|uniref:DUF551 domain-containing protein n=1 Tax=Pantoea septica TaxID=472695 RepID=A0ABX3UPM2_9GAMM|nr:DUF551 domain-containing protein [Pantoea septica]ORM96284.1 hypothetical protein HA46_17300 [Pantoea septica]